MKYIYWYLFVLVGIFGLSSCLSVEDKLITEINIDTADPVFQKIYNLQDKQEVDSLILFFKDKDPSYRLTAAMAFASIGGSKAEKRIDSLATLLDDDILDVRAAAAYALGQIGSEDAAPLLLKAFQPRDSLSQNVKMNANILEALGKCGSASMLKSMSTARNYFRSDTLLLEGLARGIYGFGLRDIKDENATAKMVEYLSKPGYPNSVRLLAANYLSRFNGIQIDSFTSTLISVYNLEEDPDIKMALAIGMGKTRKPIAIRALMDALDIEKDYRVKCNIIRAFGNFDYSFTQSKVYELLKDSNPHVSAAAASHFYNSGIPQDATVYLLQGRDTTLSYKTRINLYKAANKWLPYYKEMTRNRINRELRTSLLSTTSPSRKAMILDAMSEFPWNYKYIFENTREEKDPIVLTAIAGALAKISNRSDFDIFFGQSRRLVRRNLASYFTSIVQEGDIGALAELSGALANKNADYKAYIEDPSFLNSAQLKLKLPKEVETYNALQTAIDYFNGKDKSLATEIKFNHPIDWGVVNSLDEKSEAIVTTNKGKIRIQLFKDLAPGSVANFAQLASNGFYNDKTFHRVVSNFVIQTGCPRGDGYGSLDYSIRSELPQVYYEQEGYVGMASAGRHTECTQWFITHSPAPHLSGRYTIIGKVTDGMDVVHQIQQGDKINQITVD